MKGAKQHGTRTGNWLTAAQAEQLINAPDTATLKGKRDRALLAVLIGCGLRRSEISELTFGQIAQRDGRWAIVDLHGKGNRVRTVPMPAWAKAAIGAWAAAAGRTEGHVFRPLNNRSQITGEMLLPQNVVEAVARNGTPDRRRADPTQPGACFDSDDGTVSGCPAGSGGCRAIGWG